MKQNKSPRLLNLPIEISSKLYIGDYFGDTLQLSALEHATFGALLLHTWLSGPVKRWKFAVATGLPLKEWRQVRQTILPLYSTAAANIERWKKAIRAYDGKRLPPEDWYIIRTIVLARDDYTCAYCGGTGTPHVDHIIPISRNGSNAFDNLITSCGPCNQSKGSKLLAEWSAI